MYNCEGKVSGIISDLKKQTYSNFEAVLIDDGSTDSTYRVSVESCKDDKRFKIFRTKIMVQVVLEILEYQRFLENTSGLLTPMIGLTKRA